MKSTIEFCIFKLVYVPNLSSNWQFWFFVPNLPKKRYLRSKREIVSITMEFKFQLKLTIWVFGPNLHKKGTIKQNNQSNKLQAFAFCVVKVNSAIIFEHFKDFKNLLTLFRGGGWAKKRTTSFSPITSINVGIIPLNFATPNYFVTLV